MPDITKIIKTFDEELERTGKSYLTPPKGNLILERKGLLNDRSERSGLPLRKLLRQGKIPHAFQTGGKGSEWRIPHSSSKNSMLSNYPAIKEKKPRGKKTAINQENDFSERKKKIEEARENYKPVKIKYLLIAEAPPKSIERFFYYLDVKTADWLFLGVMEALYPSEKQEYLLQKRKSKLKEKLLLKFMGEGFYLIDLLDFPLSFYSEDLSNTTDALVKKVKQLSTKETKVILIKANVYDTVYSILKEEGVKVIDKRIDFPASGGQLKFQKKFKEALKEAGYFRLCRQ